MTEIEMHRASYEAFRAAGWDTPEECLSAYKNLEASYQRLKTLIEKATIPGGFFICGEAGEREEMGLPEMILVCPEEGLDGFAVYKKTSPYSAPGY